MALIILSRPFPRGISMRITYVRAGSHLLHGRPRDALEALSLGAMHRAGALYRGTIAEVEMARSRGRLRELVLSFFLSRSSERRAAALRDAEAGRRRFLTGYF